MSAKTTRIARLAGALLIALGGAASAVPTATAQTPLKKAPEALIQLNRTSARWRRRRSGFSPVSASPGSQRSRPTLSHRRHPSRRHPDRDKVDVILGLGGGDAIQGGGANDFLCGRTGVDYIYGESGGDFIFGGPGFDRYYDPFRTDRAFTVELGVHR